ncbi:unnamed protein product [Amoebophrya sp. A120]|nr:unnamed protein product [Amoebophrya sp. A120]|eukprot:GSA120T00000507001.1
MNGGGGTSLSALSRRKPAGRDINRHAAESGTKAKKQHQQRGSSNEKEPGVPAGVQHEHPTEHDGLEQPSAINTSSEDDTTMNFLPADDSSASYLEKAAAPATTTAGSQRRPAESRRRLFSDTQPLSMNNGEQSEETADSTAVVPDTTSTTRSAEKMKRDPAGGCSSFPGCGEDEDEEKDKEHQAAAAEQVEQQRQELQKQLQEEEAKVRAHYEKERERLYSTFYKWRDAEEGREQERGREINAYEQRLRDQQAASNGALQRVQSELQQAKAQLLNQRQQSVSVDDLKVTQRRELALQKTQLDEKIADENRMYRDSLAALEDPEMKDVRKDTALALLENAIKKQEDENKKLRDEQLGLIAELHALQESKQSAVRKLYEEQRTELDKQNADNQKLWDQFEQQRLASQQAWDAKKKQLEERIRAKDAIIRELLQPNPAPPASIPAAAAQTPNRPAPREAAPSQAMHSQPGRKRMNGSEGPGQIGQHSSFLGCSEDEDEEEKDKKEKHEPGSQATQASQQVLAAQQAAEREEQLQKQLQEEEAKMRAHYEQEKDRLYSTYDEWQEKEKGREQERQREKEQHDRELEAATNKIKLDGREFHELMTEYQKVLEQVKGLRTEKARLEGKVGEKDHQIFLALKQQRDADQELRTQFEGQLRKKDEQIQKLEQQQRQPQTVPPASPAQQRQPQTVPPAPRAAGPFPSMDRTQGMLWGGLPGDQGGQATTINPAPLQRGQGAPQQRQRFGGAPISEPGSNRGGQPPMQPGANGQGPRTGFSL